MCLCLSNQYFNSSNLPVNPSMTEFFDSLRRFVNSCFASFNHNEMINIFKFEVRCHKERVSYVFKEVFWRYVHAFLIWSELVPIVESAIQK